MTYHYPLHQGCSFVYVSIQAPLVSYQKKRKRKDLFQIAIASFSQFCLIRKLERRDTEWNRIKMSYTNESMTKLIDDLQVLYKLFHAIHIIQIVCFCPNKLTTHESIINNYKLTSKNRFKNYCFS